MQAVGEWLNKAQKEKVTCGSKALRVRFCSGWLWGHGAGLLTTSSSGAESIQGRLASAWWWMASVVTTVAAHRMLKRVSFLFNFLPSSVLLIHVRKNLLKKRVTRECIPRKSLAKLVKCLLHLLLQLLQLILHILSA